MVAAVKYANMDVKQKNIGDWLKSLTEEQRQAHYAKMQEKRREYVANKRKLKMSAEEKAREMLPELLARDMIAEKTGEFRPSEETLMKLRDLISKGYTVEQMRSGPFRGLEQKVWDSIIKHLFKNHVGQIEDLGITLIQSRKLAMSRLQKRARMIRKEMKEWKKSGKRVPPKLFSELGACEDKIHSIEVELTKTLYQVEAVGEKAKAPSITLNFGTPRPSPVEEKVVVVAEE